MGRPRRTPKNESEERELERLRENQKNCRQRKLDKVDEYEKTISSLNQTLRDQFQQFDGRKNEFNRIQNAFNGASMNLEDKRRVEEIYSQLHNITNAVDVIKKNYHQNSNDGS